MTPAEAAARNQEHIILGMIGTLADHVREMRQSDAVANSAQIKALTGDLQARWVELRALRAPPVRADATLPAAGKRKARTPQ